jgi:hypothetical protein
MRSLSVFHTTPSKFGSAFFSLPLVRAIASGGGIRRTCVEFAKSTFFVGSSGAGASDSLKELDIHEKDQ